MSKTTSREIRLISRPKGIPTAANFTLARIELAPPQDGQVLVRNRYMSVDPYMRGRMNSGKSYVPPFEIGKPLEGGAVGEVIESRAEGFKPGDAVTSSFGWREYFIASPKELHPVSREIQPLSVYLGALGMTGMTAWAGLHLMEIRAGETIFISGAAGAVGSVAGQLAKLRGCRVIGSAGSMDKVMFLREECGFDVAFDYKVGPVLEQLNVEAPDGIDVYLTDSAGRPIDYAQGLSHVTLPRSSLAASEHARWLRPRARGMATPRRAQHRRTVGAVAASGPLARSRQPHRR